MGTHHFATIFSNNLLQGNSCDEGLGDEAVAVQTALDARRQRSPLWYCWNWLTIDRSLEVPPRHVPSRPTSFASDTDLASRPL